MESALTVHDVPRIAQVAISFIFTHDEWTVKCQFFHVNSNIFTVNITKPPMMIYVCATNGRDMFSCSI